MTSTPDDDAPTRRLRPIHVALGLGAAVAGTAVVVGAVGRVAGYARVRDALAGAEYGWLGLCAVGQVVVFGGYAGALRTAVAFEDGPQLPPRLAVVLVFAGFAATQTLAFGGVGGLAVVYWALRRLGRDRRDAAVRLIGLNTAVYLAFGAIGWLAAAVAIVAGSAPLGITVPWLVAIPTLVVAARWFTDPARLDRWTAPGGGLARRGLATGVGAAAWVRRALGTARGRPVFAWAALYWLGNVASLWAALQAFGAAIPLTAITLAYVTGYLAQSLPIPLIATSGVDAATTVVLHALGVPLEVALVAVVAHRLFAFWLPVIPGTVAAVLLPRTGRSLEAVAVTPTPG